MNYSTDVLYTYSSTDVPEYNQKTAGHEATIHFPSLHTNQVIHRRKTIGKYSFEM
jgi:hypothetical protein